MPLLFQAKHSGSDDAMIDEAARHAYQARPTEFFRQSGLQLTGQLPSRGFHPWVGVAKDHPLC